ncbi:DNA-binding protein [Weissella muntiaci]|uniref:DNA-binding protein n=1 Tax=Weissella muntiaci TaxID=2508881 RepID=A0A6C2C484_9LACO|nr:helix-turn-helix domain-containing protein [Weissella muntiaci]TYC48373.1 DNA-binding protein [Weissella muntiaci]
MHSIADWAPFVALNGAIHKLIDAIDRLTIQSPWLLQKEAVKYVRLSNNTFVALVDKGVIKKHSLDEYGIVKTLYNVKELDEWLLKQK